MKKLLIVCIGFLFIGCNIQPQQRCMYITKIIKYDEKYCNYFIRTNGPFRDIYILDTIGRWKIGDTILISSLYQIKAEKE